MMKNRTTTTTIGFNCFKQPAVTGDDVASVQEVSSEERKIIGCYSTRRASLYGPLKAAVLPKTLSIKKSPSEKPSKSSQFASRGKTLFRMKNKKSSYQSSSLSEHKESAGVTCRRTNHCSIDYSSNSSSSSSSNCIASNPMPESQLIKQAPCDHNHTRRSKLTFKSQKLMISRDRTKCMEYSYYEPELEAFCIVMVCLSALVFCGKGFAIMACTWTWFFLALSRGRKMYCVRPSIYGTNRK